MIAALLRDRMVRAFLLLGVVLSLPVVLPVMDEETRFEYVELYVDQALLAFALVCILLTRRGLGNGAERRFWNLLVASLGCWLAFRVLNVLVLEEFQWDRRLCLVGDVLYSLFYCLLLLALEQRPSIRPEPDRRGALRSLTQVGTVLFVGGLLTYFVVIGVALDQPEYDTWVPSSLLYLSLDLCVILRLASLVLDCDSIRWGRVYGWLLTAACLWAVSDLLQVLSQMGVAFNLFGELVWQAAWFLPFGALVAAARSGVLSVGRARKARVERNRDLFHGLWGGTLLVYAGLVPAIHFILDQTSILGPAASGGRGVCALSLFLLLVVLALAYLKHLLADNQRMRAADLSIRSRLRLAEHMESIGPLAGSVAHDLANLLQIILANTETLHEQLKDDPDRCQHLDDILDAVGMAGSLTTRLRQISRMRGTQSSLVDVNQLLEGMVPMLDRVVGRTIDVDLQCGSIRPIRADREQFERAVLNLVVNARDAMPDGGTVRIRTRVMEVVGPGAGSQVAVTVEDTGIGMCEETRLRAVEPFFTTKTDQGSGLGLPMVSSFAVETGGELQIQSAPGRGTRVCLVLQGAPEEDPVGSTPAKSLYPAGTGILVVEDEDEMRRLVSGLLKELGYRVREAKNGVDALQLLAEHEGEIDLVLSDVVMPRMGGQELATQVEQQYPGKRVILMTGYEAPVRASGEGSLLQKPFTSGQLARRVRDALTFP